MIYIYGFPGGSVDKEFSCKMLKMQIQYLDQEDPLEKGVATHSSILVRRIPGTEESGRLQPMGHKESDTTE